jgi:hypothetical protein
MDETVRADAAKQLLGNPTFEMAIKAMKDEVIAQWAVVPARDTQAREWLWMFYQNTMKFEDMLRGYVATGKLVMAQRQSESVAKRVSQLFQKSGFKS